MAYSVSLAHDEDLSMQAHEFMTKDPVTVSPDTPMPEIARLLLAHRISAAPSADWSIYHTYGTRLGHRGTPPVRCSDEVVMSSPPAP
jgi:hypothetical protein